MAAYWKAGASLLMGVAVLAATPRAQSHGRDVASVKGYGTHVFQIDSDIVVPPDALVRLLKHDKDIVGCPYPMRKWPHALVGLPKDTTKFEGLEPCHFLPGGCMLVRTDVYRKLKKPWYFESYEYAGGVRAQLEQIITDATNGAFGFGFPADVLRAALETIPDVYTARQKLTRTAGEDTNFCWKAQRAGFTVFGDLDLMRELQHIGKLPISLAHQDHSEMKPGTTADEAMRELSAGGVA